jgi:hypothetical protein
MRRRNFSRRGVLKGSTAAALTLYAAPLRAAPTRGQLALRDRIFEVSSAEISKVSDGIWSVDIETKAKVYDEENWAPRLYHQGLRPIHVLAPLNGCQLSTPGGWADLRVWSSRRLQLRASLRIVSERTACPGLGGSLRGFMGRAVSR